MAQNRENSSVMKKREKWLDVWIKPVILAQRRIKKKVS